MKHRPASKPSNNPQNMRDGSWYYEDRRGIDVIKSTETTCVSGPGYVLTTSSRITWGRLIKSLERCGYKVTKVNP